MAKKFAWEKLSQEELLDVRICDLELTIQGTWVEKCVQKLHSELAAKKLKFKPHVWVSDDWYCADGIPGIALPFFLLHPRLIKLEKEMIGEAEGATRAWCMKLLRHEAGHAIDNAFKLRLSKKRQKLFGLSSIDYPDSYEANPIDKNFVQHLEAGYAQAHPDEDWAETFAVWLTPNSGWRNKYKTWNALRKLELLDEICTSLQGKKPLVQNQKVVSPSDKSKMTLRQYYQQRKKRFGLHEKSMMEKDLKTILGMTSSPRAIQILPEVREQICQEVAKRTNHQHHRIDRMLDEVLIVCRQNKLALSTADKKVRKKLTGLLAQKASSFVKKGKHRIAM